MFSSIFSRAEEMSGFVQDSVSILSLGKSPSMASDANSDWLLACVELCDWSICWLAECVASLTLGKEAAIPEGRESEK